MPVEIERKFLVTDRSWEEGISGTRMSQGYLSEGGINTVRVRLAGEVAWLTIKGGASGISRPEFEYEIPAADARELLRLCPSALVEKTRYKIPYAGFTWEVDVFHGPNEGLIVAEVELAEESENPAFPSWVGEEVSFDRRYSNSSLAIFPFCRWNDSKIP